MAVAAFAGRCRWVCAAMNPVRSERNDYGDCEQKQDAVRVMKQPRDRPGDDNTPSVDVVVTGVDDLDAIRAAESDVREAFAAAAVHGIWTVALRPRSAVGGWTVGIVGRRDGARVHANLKIEPAVDLRTRMTAVFGTAAETDVQ
jgi:hypothetical protein